MPQEVQRVGESADEAQGGEEQDESRRRWPHRLSRKAEIQLIKQLPKAQKFILITKVSAVVLFAIGLEGLYLGNWWMAGAFLLLGVLFTIWPMRMNLPNVCPRCGNVVKLSQAVCDRCGVALM